MPSRITELIGEPLSGIAFVQDYVEFHFNGRVLRSLTRPMVTAADGVTFKLPDPGSRDALCAFIGRTATNVVVREGERIELRFADGSRIDVLLAEETHPGPEAAHYMPGDGRPMEVWELC